MEDGSFAEGTVEAVLSGVFLNEAIDGVIGDVLDGLDEVTDAVGVDGIAKPEFGFHFIAFGNGDLTHVVTEANEAGALPIVPARGGAGPGGEAVEGMGIFPVAGDHFTIEAHAAHDEAEFPVAVCALVKVHEIHIDLVPGDVPVELGMQVKEGFVENAESADPHFCGGESMHPGNDAYAVRGIVGFDAGLVDLFGGFDGRAVNDPYGDVGVVVEGLGDGLRMSGHLSKCFFSVEVLAAGDEPDLECF